MTQLDYQKEIMDTLHRAQTELEPNQLLMFLAEAIRMMTTVMIVAASTRGK